LRDDDAQVVLLVRAVEEEDPEGQLLPLHSRTSATRRILDESEQTAERDMVVRRARELTAELTSRLALLPGLRQVLRLQFGAVPWLILAALLAGLTTNLLGPRHQINLLASPVTGVLAWNFLVYLAGLAGRSHRLSSVLAKSLTLGAVRRRLRGWKRTGGGTAGDFTIASRALTRFASLWTTAAGPLLAARVRKALHLGATALAVGAVGGMYVRGIAFEYRATWESTWLDAGQVQAILGFVLGPAAILTGMSVPDVAPLTGSGANAAPWIHLFAVTVLLYVILPRTVLATYEGWRCRRLAGSVPVNLGDGYFRKIISGRRGSQTRVDVVPYSFRPEPVVLDRLKAVLHDFFGTRADIRALPPLAYGEEAALPEREAIDDGVEAEERPRTCRVILFNLAQSPETEVHGELLREIKERLPRDHGQLLVIVDPHAYRKRVESPERLAERHRAWSRVAGDVGLSAVSFDPESSDGQVLDSMGSALWPAARSPGTG